MVTSLKQKQEINFAFYKYVELLRDPKLESLVLQIIPYLYPANPLLKPFNIHRVISLYDGKSDPHTNFLRLVEKSQRDEFLQMIHEELL